MKLRELNAFKQVDVCLLGGGIYCRLPSLQNPGHQNDNNWILNFLPKISLKIEMGKNVISVQNVYWSMPMNTANRKKNDEIE